MSSSRADQHSRVHVPAAPETGPLVRVRLLVAYDGSAFHGFAFQTSGVRTVAGALRAAAARLMGYEPDLAVAGRTDTGVHAWGQVVSFDVPLATVGRFGLPRIQRSMNRQLAPEIVVREIDEAPEGFDARHSATLRRYRYAVLNTATPSPFLASTTWWVPGALDLDAMNEASAAIVGEHDFSSFCRRPSDDVHLVRRITSARWFRPEPDIVRFDVDATAFCHQMVRSLTGTLVAIGLGKRKPAEMATIRDARNRQRAATPAPPQGLCLHAVEYGEQGSSEGRSTRRTC